MTVLKKLKFKTPAKINLGLHIHEKRKDSEEVELIEIPKDRFLFAREKVLEVLSQIPDKNYFTLIENLDKYELKQTFLSCKKIVDNLANVFGKHIQLEIKGGEFFLERDKAILLKDSIVHIMQNSCDHGIKDKGSIILKIKDDNKNLIIYIKDDGKGLDPSIIYKKAIEKGLVSESQDYTDKQKINFIFEPGFSTKKEATQYSGRGVGMDVVKTNILKLGGTIDISSILGKGTGTTIKIPKKD